MISYRSMTEPSHPLPKPCQMVLVFWLKRSDALPPIILTLSRPSSYSLSPWSCKSFRLHNFKINHKQSIHIIPSRSLSPSACILLWIFMVHSSRRWYEFGEAFDKPLAELCWNAKLINCICNGQIKYTKFVGQKLFVSISPFSFSNCIYGQFITKF